MKSIKLITITFIVFTCLAGCYNNPTGSNANLNNQRDTAFYYMGYLFGQNFNEKPFQDPNMKAMVAGLYDAKNKLEMNKSLDELNEYIVEYIDNYINILGQENLKKGEDFLKKNLKNKDVKELVDGIQYKVLVQGTGEIPKETDRVKVNYKGTIISGEEFDSTEKRGEPAIIPLDGVIQGWKKSISQMPVGSKWIVYLPADQAYGDRNIGSTVLPNSVLIFEIELLEIIKD